MQNRVYLPAFYRFLLALICPNEPVNRFYYYGLIFASGQVDGKFSVLDWDRQVMRQQSIDLQNEFQTTPVTQETFFNEETVQTIPAVIPLDETPTKTSARFTGKRRIRVPQMRKEDNSFNPAFLIMAFVAVTALGVIAGTLLYQASAEKSANNAAVETDEPGNRTIPAQYQFIVDKPESSASTTTGTRDNSASLPSSTTSEPARNNSRIGGNSQQTEEASGQQSDGENEEQNAENEEARTEDQQAAITPSRNEDDEDLPPPPPLRRERRDDKKQDKAKPKNNNSPQPENRENEQQPAADSGVDNEN